MMTKSLLIAKFALFKLGGTWLLRFALWGFVMEEEYDFNLVLRCVISLKTHLIFNPFF